MIMATCFESPVVVTLQKESSVHITNTHRCRTALPVCSIPSGFRFKKRMDRFLP